MPSSKFYILSNFVMKIIPLGFHISSYELFMFYFVLRKYRHVAYRQAVWWCWGYLGRHNKVPLPSCIMDKIHQTYSMQMASERDSDNLSWMSVLLFVSKVKCNNWPSCILYMRMPILLILNTTHCFWLTAVNLFYNV